MGVETIDERATEVVEQAERALRAQLLDQIGQSLEQLVVPALRGSSAGVVVDLVLRLVAQLQSWDTNYTALESVRGDEEGAAAATAARLVAAPSASDKDAVIALMERSGAAADPALREGALDCLARLWRAEWAFRDALDWEVKLGRASLFGGGALPREDDADAPATDERSAVAEPTITAKKFETYISANHWPDAQVESFALLPGGFGKETSLATVRVGDDVQKIVIRRDLPTSANGCLVKDETPVIQAAFEAGIAVAEPLWLETGPVFETPFLVSRAVAGSTDPAAWRDRPEAVARFADDLGRALAGVHALPPVPELLGSDGAQPTRYWIEREIDTYGRILNERDDAPSSLLPAAFAWLRANIPDSGVDPRVLHGDVGFHNMLMQDGGIVALIDWEYAHMGDPQQELNYVRPFVDELGAWDAFLAAYVRHGGVAYREEDAPFWRTWTGIRTSIGCVGAMRAFEAGHYANPDAALKLAVAGLNFGPRHLLYSVQDLLGATPPPSAGGKP